MSAVVKHAETAPAETSAHNILSVIERAALNPDIDIEKMQRLLDMQERIIARQAEQEFNSAMKDAQGEMRPVAADAENPQTKSKYATYAKLDAALRPIYTKHGFALSFDEGDSPKADHIRVLCYVTHDGGHSRTYRKDMPADGKGARGGDVMTKTHASGAAASYGMRYLLKGIFNVAVGSDDADGNEPAAPINEEQLNRLRERADEVGADLERFCRYLQINALPDLPAAKFAAAMKALDAKGKK